MIAALYQSRPTDSGGTRKFNYKGVNFGWRVIEDMYYREVDRRKASLCSRVPKLKPNHIYRDAWTRLNVVPSKIMQVFVLCLDVEIACFIKCSKMKSSQSWLNMLIVILCLTTLHVWKQLSSIFRHLISFLS